MLCSLVSRQGRCGQALDPEGIHLNQCKCGGHVSRRHDRVVRWLAAWLQDGRVESDVLVEQVAPSEACPDGRLDLTFDDGGRRIWIDVAIVAVQSANPAAATMRAKRDGAAARDAELDKRRRYAGLATPFVMEALGRPGTCARGVIGQYAKEDENGSSADAAAAWQSLSAIVQADSARTELRACGWNPADWAEASLEVP